MTTNDFDPTTNRIPFGLLNEEEQKIMRAWPHEWEYYFLDEWKPITSPFWCWNLVYRGLPKPPVVTSVYRNIAPSVANFLSRADADRFVCQDRIAVLRIDTCNGVSTAHLEEI